MIKSANITASVSRNAGGLYESVRRLVQSLAAGGMQMRVLGVRDEFTDTDLAAWQPVPVRAFKPAWPRKFGYSRGFLQDLHDFNPDIVHTHSIWVYPSIASSTYCRKANRPGLISAHGMLDPWAIRNSRWKKAIAHFLFEGSHLREARCLRALCEPEALAIRNLNLKNEIAIIPNGIDLPVLGNAETLKTETLKSECRNPPWHGVLEPGRKVLLFLSRIHPKKGLVNLLKAWAQIQRSVVSGQVVSGLTPEWTLAIAGWDQGGHEAELKRLCNELGIAWKDVRTVGTTGQQDNMTTGAEVRGQRSEVSGPSSVVFLGPQFGDAKTACYQHCDAFILPSFSEGVPMVVLEAWAYSKPVVMTPECNLPEGFTTNAAIRIETDVESIVHGLEQLFQSSSSVLCSLGVNGRALVARKFVWPRIAEQMAGVYEWMLGGGPKPDCVI